MATKEDIFKVVEIGGRTFTITYGGTVINGNGEIETGKWVNRVKRHSNWLKSSLVTANKDTGKKTKSDKTVKPKLDVDLDVDKGEHILDYITAAAGSVKDFIEGAVGDKKAEATEGWYVSANKAHIYYRSEDGSWFQLHPTTGDLIKEGKSPKLEALVERAGKLVPTTADSPEFNEALERSGFIFDENRGNLFQHYGVGKGVENVLEFLANAGTNIFVDPYQALLSGDASKVLTLEKHVDVDLVSEYGKALAEEMKEKGDPELVFLYTLPTEFLLDLMTVGAGTKLLTAAGKLTPNGKLAKQVSEALGGNDKVDWDEFKADPKRYAESVLTPEEIPSKLSIKEARVKVKTTRIERDIGRLKDNLSKQDGVSFTKYGQLDTYSVKRNQLPIKAKIQIGKLNKLNRKWNNLNSPYLNVKTNVVRRVVDNAGEAAVRIAPDLIHIVTHPLTGIPLAAVRIIGKSIKKVVRKAVDKRTAALRLSDDKFKLIARQLRDEPKNAPVRIRLADKIRQVRRARSKDKVGAALIRINNGIKVITRSKVVKAVNAVTKIRSKLITLPVRIAGKTVKAVVKIPKKYILLIPRKPLTTSKPPVAGSVYKPNFDNTVNTFNYESPGLLRSNAPTRGAKNIKGEVLKGVNSLVKVS